MGINDRVQLATAAAILRSRINRELMLSGVTLIDPAAAYIEEGVVIGADTIDLSECPSLAAVPLSAPGCLIEPGVIIRDCSMGDRCDHQGRFRAYRVNGRR